MFIFCPIQPTFNPSARELVLARVIGIVNRYLVSVVKTRFRRVTFLLLLILNSISKTQGFKFTSQLPKGYLDKILIVRFSKINFLLDTWVIPNYQLTYLMFDAMVNYQTSRLIQVVSNAVISPLIKSCLFMSERLYAPYKA